MEPCTPIYRNSPGNSPQQVLLTIDVEDWFQVENFKGSIPFSSWEAREVRVEQNTHRLLDLFDSAQATAFATPGQASSRPLRMTFFVLGWLAGRMPNLVREIEKRGHEVASHGYRHTLCSQCTAKELVNDLTTSKKLLEDIVGARVNGYRAPSFSVSEDMLKVVQDCGFFYDSSYNSFAANKRHGKMNFSRFPRTGVARRIHSRFYEIPVSNLEFCGFTLPFGGGAYFRLYPLAVFMRGVRSILETQGAYVFYLHPWEIDPQQPKVVESSLVAKFRHYSNLHTTYAKLSLLLMHLKEFHFVTCSQYLAERQQQAG